MFKRFTMIMGALLAISTLPASIQVSAHGEKKQPTDQKAGKNMTMMHNHDKWMTPPAPYKGMVNPDWTNDRATERGRVIYEDHCASCHGSDGFGKGVAAVDLEHKPANMNHHFHMAPGDGDDYLYWRVSEGGEVEPFKSMKSAMPGFKEILEESERWDVLNYVHAKFHNGYKKH